MFLYLLLALFLSACSSGSSEQSSDTAATDTEETQTPRGLEMFDPATPPAEITQSEACARIRDFAGLAGTTASPCGFSLS